MPDVSITYCKPCGYLSKAEAQHPSCRSSSELKRR